MIFVELRRGNGGWLSENFDLNVNEQANFIFDGFGWSCHRGASSDILADKQRNRDVLPR